MNCATSSSLWFDFVVGAVGHKMQQKMDIYLYFQFYRSSAFSSFLIKQVWIPFCNCLMPSAKYSITFTHITFKKSLLSVQSLNFSLRACLLTLATGKWIAGVGYIYRKRYMIQEKWYKTSSFVFSWTAVFSLNSTSFNLNFVFSKSFLIFSFSLAKDKDDKEYISFWRFWIWTRNSDFSISWFSLSSWKKIRLCQKWNQLNGRNVQIEKNNNNSIPLMNLQNFEFVNLIPVSYSEVLKLDSREHAKLQKEILRNLNTG